MSRTTVSEILFGDRNKEERALLLHWCELAASQGGSFSITERWTGNWLQVFTINWPDGDNAAHGESHE
ncbi:hypothetical protein KMC49_gp39 [Ralstonia phage Firinga]|uniref:Uncharacterized protein n=1 Tax=Ralstonia phage Firinga TaxID=2759725 RepID=A0A7G5B9Y4_9CAUD|nr:hypothetical protein KMC49_gp39 [Ralstonia phage Firinga]QMV33107.1 hypothetical protein 18C_00039 [Ralstonia phage Firinga]